VLGYEDWRMQSERVRFLQLRVENFAQQVMYDNATDVELAETQSRLAIAQAELLQAADYLRTSARQLQAHIGQRPQNLRSLSRQWQHQPMTQPLAELVEHATQQNREIQAAYQETAVYQARLDAATSQYFPTLDLTASLSRGESEDLATLSQRSNTFSIGVNVTIPIFTGGYTTANRSQARHQLNQAQYRYQGLVGKIQSDIHKYYSLYSSGAQRVQALERAVRSAELSLDSAQKSFRVGAASNIDVLDAQDELVSARYAYFKARLEVLMAQLRLQAAMGLSLHEPIAQMTQHHFQGAIITLPMGLNTWQDSADGWTLYRLAPSSPTHYVDIDQLISRLYPPQSTD